MNHLTFHLEPLEARQMLAGNVTAVVNGAGDLIVNGDASANAISVAVDSLGDVTVTGHDDTQVDTSGIDRAVSGDIVIRLRGGDDWVTIDNELATADVRVSGSGGNDTLTVEGTANSVRMLGGSGDDFISMVAATNSATMRGFTGNDHLWVNPIGDIGSLYMRSFKGDDSVTVIAHFEIADMTVLTDAGNDTITLNDVGASGIIEVNLNAGGGDDFFNIDLTETVGVGFGGEGLDQIFSQSSSFGEVNWHDIEEVLS